MYVPPMKKTACLWYWIRCLRRNLLTANIENDTLYAYLQTISRSVNSRLARSVAQYRILKQMYQEVLMGQIANQMAVEMLCRLKDKIKMKRDMKKAQKEKPRKDRGKE